MKAIVIEKPGQIQVKDLPMPEIGPDEVLIRLGAMGICHSDVEILEGKFIVPVKYPIIPGHEWAGEVAQVGTQVDRVVLGDKVVGDCRVGANDYFGLTFDGSGAEFFKAKQEWLHKVPPELSWTQAALVEPFTVAYYALHVQGGTDASEWVAILGGGTIGLCCLAAARGMGARTILIDPASERRAVAAGMGADVTVDPSAGSIEAVVNDTTGGRGADLVLEASGVGAALASALQIVGQFGRVTYVGFNIGEQVTSQLGLIQSKDLSIKGITGSTGVWPKAIRFIGTAGIDLSPLVSSRFRLAQADQAFEQVRRHAVGVKAHIVVADSA